MAKPCTKSNWKFDFEKGVCLYCNKGNEEDVDCGKLLTDKDSDISVHNYCLLFASGLSQSGDDTEGIDGFLVPDIVREYRRAKRLKCYYCTRVRATIGCSVQNCRRGYHFDCGFKKDALFLFFDTFLSYCVDHRPQQVGPVRVTSQIPVTCPICMDDVEAKVSNHTLKTPCCNNTWFHRTCVQRQALSAGYFFRCAICNNQEEFQNEMKQFGIYIPEHDASWEKEDNAYQELYWRHDKCDIDSCKCPDGRNFNEAASKWELVLCDLCGSCGCHLACGGLKNVNQDWACNLCSAMLSNATEVNCPSASTSQKSSSSFADSPTKIGNSTRTAMKLMGKHPRTPLSAHTSRKTMTTMSSQPLDSHDVFDHCRPSTSTDGLLETGSSPNRKRKLSFNSKENTNAISENMGFKKHCSWKTQPADFWHNYGKDLTSTSSGSTYGQRTTLRMSMRPRKCPKPSSSCPIPTKSCKSKTTETTKNNVKKKSCKTKNKSSFVSNKIESYFSPAPRKIQDDLPIYSVNKKCVSATKRSSEPVPGGHDDPDMGSEVKKPASNVDTVHGQPIPIRSTPCKSSPKSSPKSTVDCSTPASPTATGVTRLMPDEEGNLNQELQHNAGPYPDISTHQTAESMQNNAQNGTQSHASQHEETSSSQVQSQHNQDMADFKENDPKSPCLKPPVKNIKKKKFSRMYPSVGCYIKKYRTTQKRGWKQKRREAERARDRKEGAKPRQVIAETTTCKKPVLNQVRVTSGGMLLRRLIARGSGTLDSHSNNKNSLPSLAIASKKIPVKIEDNMRVGATAAEIRMASPLRRREEMDDLERERSVCYSIGHTQASEDAKETLSLPDAVRLTRRALLRTYDSRKIQDVGHISEIDETIHSHRDELASSVSFKTTSDDASQTALQPDTCTTKRSTGALLGTHEDENVRDVLLNDDAASEEEGKTASEHKTSTSQQPNQTHEGSTDIADAINTDSVSGAVAVVPDVTHGKEISLSPPQGNEKRPGLEIRRPSSTESVLLPEASPDSGISQGYCCNSDELITEKPPTPPSWLPQDSISPIPSNSEISKTIVYMVVEHTRNATDSEDVFLGTTNSNDIREDEVLKPTDLEQVQNDQHFDTLREDSPQNASPNLRSSSPDFIGKKDELVSLFSSSTNSKHRPEHSQSTPTLTSPVKPAQLKPFCTSDISNGHVSPHIFNFSTKPNSCPAKCQTDKSEEDIDKGNVTDTGGMTFTRSLQNVCTKIRAQLFTVSQDQNSTETPLKTGPKTGPPSEKSESVVPVTRMDSPKSSEIRTPGKSKAPETESISEKPLTRNTKCPFCAGCRSTQGNQCTSMSIESPRTMLLRSNSKSAVSSPEGTPSPVFNRVSLRHPRLYRAILPTSSSQKRSSRRNVPTVSFPEISKDPSRLSSYPQRRYNSPLNCQTSPTTPGSWPKKSCSSSSSHSKSSTGPPKSVKVATLDNRKTKGRIRLFIV